MWGGFRYDVGDALEPDGALPARYGTMAMQASQPPQLQLQPPQLPPPQLPPPPQLQSQSQSQQKRDMVLTISALVVMAVMLSYLERLNTRLRTLEMLVSKM